MTTLPPPDSPLDPEPSAEAEKKSRRGVALRIGVTVATLGLWWWLADLSPGELLEALERIPASAFVIALSASVGNLLVGAVRWRVLLSAFGAVRVPPFRSLVQLYFVGIFFNTFVPANVGGDVVRAHITRRAFPGQAGAYMIVLIERIFGLAGLMLLASSILLFAPIEALDRFQWLGIFGLLGASLAAVSPAIARRLAPILPGRLGELAGSLPTVRHWPLLGVVLLLSIVTQSVVAYTGHVFVHALADVALLESLILVPVALVSMYLPTIAGLGAREASFVALFALVSVSEADATAASLAVMVTQLLTAAVGGAVLLVFGTPQVESDDVE